jgi:hypothetical protein
MLGQPGFHSLGRLARADAKLHLTNRVIDGKLIVPRASKEIERLCGVQPMSLRDNARKPYASGDDLAPG